MVCLFTEGFDKYGGANNSTSVATPNLLIGDWSSVGSSAVTIVTPLSTTGQALNISVNGSPLLTKNLPGNASRLIGGMRLNIVLNSGTQPFGIGFMDGSTVQSCITFTPTTGIICVRTGTITGTILASSATGLAASTTYYVEWDITFGASSPYQVWVNGTSVISGTGNTRSTTNNYAGIFALLGAANGNSTTIDDIYLFDSTGTTNNAVLNTNPRIETVFPTSDAQAQFTIGASVLAATIIPKYISNYAGVANELNVRPFTPGRNCTLNSVTLRSANTSSSANFRAVVYSDSSGLPGTLLTGGSGTTVTGVTAGTPLTLPFASPPSLTSGTQYWLGYMTDTSINIPAESNSSGPSRRATVTFTSGAPSTAPSTTLTSAPTPNYWGNVTWTSAPANYLQQLIPPGPQLPSETSWQLNDSSTVGNEDLFTMNALSVPAANIYVAATKVYMSLSATGVRTGSVHTSSGGTDVGAASVTPNLTYSWQAQYLGQDPNTSAAWTVSAANAALAGYRLDS